MTAEEYDEALAAAYGQMLDLQAARMHEADPSLPCGGCTWCRCTWVPLDVV